MAASWLDRFDDYRYVAFNVAEIAIHRPTIGEAEAEALSKIREEEAEFRKRETEAWFRERSRVAAEAQLRMAALRAAAAADAAPPSPPSLPRSDAAGAARGDGDGGFDAHAQT